MRSKTAVPPAKEKPRLIPDTELTTNLSELLGSGQEQQLAQSNYIPMQTIGPNAKELKRRRLLAERGSRQTSERVLPDTPRKPAGQTRPRERHERRSSARGGDSGSDDSSDSSSEPPPAERLCACCDADISHLGPEAKYLNERHGNRHRQRLKRARDKANPKPVAERPTAPSSGRCPGPRPKVGRCGATLLSKDLEDGVWCAFCGIPRSPLAEPSGSSATAVEMMQLDKLAVQRRPEREWKTRPKRELAARLRKTRRDDVDESIVKGVVSM